jgi:hypothetical protein
LEEHIVGAKSPPDVRARIINPRLVLSRAGSFFQEMTRRIIVSDYLTISAHAAFVPYSTMY